MKTKKIIFGLDLGMGAIKICGPHGSVELPSHLATANRDTVDYEETGSIFGRAKNRPKKIELKNGSYYVGLGAHDWGSAIDNLSYQKLISSADIHALVYGAFSLYAQQHRINLGQYEATIVAGIPQEAMKGDSFKDTKKKVVKWLSGDHSWQCDDNPQFFQVGKVEVAGQPQGVIMDYMLDDTGRVISGREGVTRMDKLLITVGFNTVELLGMSGKSVVPNLTDGRALGVHRVRAHMRNGQHLTYGQVDTKIRNSTRDTKGAIKAWEGEVLGYIRDTWGNQWHNYPIIIASGGGAVLLNGSLSGMFAGKCQIADDPVQAVARGLYKMGVFKHG